MVLVLLYSDPSKQHWIALPLWPLLSVHIHVYKFTEPNTKHALALKHGRYLYFHQDCQGCKHQITEVQQTDALRLLQTEHQITGGATNRCTEATPNSTPTAHDRLRTYILYRVVSKPDHSVTLTIPIKGQSGTNVAKLLWQDFNSLAVSRDCIVQRMVWFVGVAWHGIDMPIETKLWVRYTRTHARTHTHTPI